MIAAAFTAIWAIFLLPLHLFITHSSQLIRPLTATKPGWIYVFNSYAFQSYYTDSIADILVSVKGASTFFTAKRFYSFLVVGIMDVDKTYFYLRSVIWQTRRYKTPVWSFPGPTRSVKFGIKSNGSIPWWTLSPFSPKARIPNGIGAI